MPGKSHGQRSLVGHSSWGHKRFGYNLATEQQQATLFIQLIKHVLNCLNLSLNSVYKLLWGKTEFELIQNTEMHLTKVFCEIWCIFNTLRFQISFDLFEELNSYPKEEICLFLFLNSLRILIALLSVCKTILYMFYLLATFIHKLSSFTFFKASICSFLYSVTVTYSSYLVPR